MVLDRRGTFPLRPGTTPPPYPIRIGGLDAILWLVVHHTGNGTARPTVDQVSTFQIGPTAQAPFPAIAYSLYVEWSSLLVVCHDLEDEPWSQGLGSPSTDANDEGVNNDKGLSICFSGQDPTDAQWRTITTAFQAAETVTGRALVLTSHRRVDPGTTDCPGTVADAACVNP